MTVRRPSIRLLDIALMVVLLALFPVAWLVPEHRWDSLAKLTDRLAPLSRRRQRRLARIQAAFSDFDSARCLQVERESRANWILRQLQLLRAYRPGGWHPKICIEGRERIDRALALGKGAVLWNGAFRFSDLVAKIGLHEAGYHLTHLSMPDHGWSNTRFGVRWLNPILVRIERRFLLKRVVIDPGNPTQATEQIRCALGGNGIVSITAIRGAARRPASVRILNSNFRIGLGAPILAYETGASLLPVFTLRGREGSFQIFVEHAITVDTDIPRIDAAMGAVQVMGKLIERHVRAAPGEWNWWDMEPLNGAIESRKE